jgi:hypothetical protein
MGKLHRSAQGKMVDMDALLSRNEHVRAVGNMNVNARGDIIDSHDNVINDNTKRVNQYYMQTALNRGIKPEEKNTAGVPLTPEQLKETTRPVRQQTLVADSTAEKIQLTAEEAAFDAEDAQLEMPKKSDSSKKD